MLGRQFWMKHFIRTLREISMRGKAAVVCLMGPRSQDLADVLLMVRSLAALDDGNRTSLLVLYENNTKQVPAAAGSTQPPAACAMSCCVIIAQPVPDPAQVTAIETLKLIERAAVAVGRSMRSAKVVLGVDPPSALPRLGSSYTLGKRVASGWGYYHMCSFFFSEVFYLPELADVRQPDSNPRR